MGYINVKQLYSVIALLLYSLSFTPALAQNTPILTAEQHDWLQQHPVITLAPDPDFPPIEYFDRHGKLQGINADYLALLEKKLNITFTIKQLPDWSSVLQQAQSREVDMFIAAATPQRQKYMDFAKPHLELPGVILVSDGVLSENLSLNELQGQRVAVVEGYVWHELITHDHPEVALVPMPNLLSALKALSFGSVDAVVANLAIATHYIRESGITNLRVAGESGYYGRYAMAVRSDWPELVEILQRGMDAISQQEHQTIMDRWVHLENDTFYTSKRFWLYLLSLAIPFIIITILLWNYQLRRSLKRHTYELSKALRQQLETEQELRNSQQHYATLFNQAYDSLFLLDGESGNVLDCNAAACRQFACDKQDFIQRSPLLLSPPTQPDGSNSQSRAKHYLLHALTGDTQLFEWQHKRCDGTLFDCEVSLTLIENNNQRFIMSMIRDISERKRIEKLKDEFISTISHEIRTPLTSIRGSLGLLKGGVMGELPEKANNLIVIANNNTERLLQLVNDLLDIQKLESSGIEFNIQEHPLNPLLELAIENNSAYAANRGIHLTLHPCDTSLNLPMDSDRIMQVMNNLLSNAAKFSPANSEVEISVEVKKETIQINVIDQGEGVPEAFIPHLFDRFSQADNTATRQVGGTGLGLNISKTIIEYHQGSLHYQRLNDRSIFSFTLPRKPPQIND